MCFSAGQTPSAPPPLPPPPTAPEPVSQQVQSIRKSDKEKRVARAQATSGRGQAVSAAGGLLTQARTADNSGTLIGG